MSFDEDVTVIEDEQAAEDEEPEQIEEVLCSVCNYTIYSSVPFVVLLYISKFYCSYRLFF